MLFFFAGCSSCCVWPDLGFLPEFTPKDAPKNLECKNVTAVTSRPGERPPVLRRECNETPTPRD